MEKQGTNMRYELAAAILPSRLRRIAMSRIGSERKNFICGQDAVCLCCCQRANGHWRPS